MLFGRNKGNINNAVPGKDPPLSDSANLFNDQLSGGHHGYKTKIDLLFAISIISLIYSHCRFPVGVQGFIGISSIFRSMVVQLL